MTSRSNLIPAALLVEAERQTNSLKKKIKRIAQSAEMKTLPALALDRIIALCSQSAKEGK